MTALRFNRWWWSDNWPLVAIVAAIVVCIAALVAASVVDAKRWDAFKAAHYCKVVAHINGDTFNTFGFDSKGNSVVGIGSTPSKTGWLCDDGVTYYR